MPIEQRGVDTPWAVITLIGLVRCRGVYGSQAQPSAVS